MTDGLRSIHAGSQTFTQIIRAGAIYVDKTAYLAKIITDPD
jgi:hypothetical protein